MESSNDNPDRKDWEPKWSLATGIRKLRGKTRASSAVAGAAPVATSMEQLPQNAEARAHERAITHMIRLIVKDKAALVGAVVIGGFMMWSIIEGLLQLIDSAFKKKYATQILGGNPLLLNFSQSEIAPSLKSFQLWFGTDFYGHSIILSILYAAPRDALAGMIVVAAGITIGMLLGTSSALLGGWFETVFMRLTDAFLAVPALILAIAIGIMVGTGYTSVLIALVIVWWPTYARFFRGEALGLKRRGFIGAARLCGTGSFRILIRHIIPNSLDPIIAYAALDFGNVILAYSSLAFLGIGVQPPIPEWGEMASTGLSYMPGIWWWTMFPALVILAIVISFTVVGDRLQDVISGRYA